MIRDPGSYRDPSGYVFYENDKIFRTISESYKKHYELLMNSGLYEELVNKKMLISHSEKPTIDSAYKVIQPELIKTISYPYEWSFEQLKDVGLRLLEIQKIAIKFNMTLKDATPFNFQFVKNNPVMIDTLSFEEYVEGQLWIPYQQFCESIISPLLLAQYVDPRMLAITRVFKDGIPLDITSKTLPFKTKFMFSTYLNIHAHAKSQVKHSTKTKNTEKKLSKNSFLGVINNVESLVKGIKLPNKKTTWSDYYDETNYSDSSFQQKQFIVGNILEEIKPNVVLDLGSNTGVFAEIAHKFTDHVIACDNDHGAIGRLYDQCKKDHSSILPLVLDITNPSTDLGWMNKERSSFFVRIKPDVVLALALVHHLAIANNVPFEKIAEFFKTITSSLIIEFVPKSDSKVQTMLSTKDDAFESYTQENFEKSMEKYFTKKRAYELENSERMIYHFDVL